MATDLTVVICINRRLGVDKPSCAGAGSESLAEALAERLEAEKLSIPIKRVECLGQCEKGPNLRIAPGGRFFHHLSREDFAEVIAELRRITAMDAK